MCVHAYADVHIEVKGTLLVTCSHLLLCRFKFGCSGLVASTFI